MDVIGGVRTPETLVRTENALLRVVPKRGNFQDRVEPVNLRLKEKVDGVGDDRLGESTVVSIATDGTSTVLVAEINDEKRLFVSRTLQGDLEEVELGFTPRIVLYGQATDARTHYTENITYDDINKSAGFSDPVPDPDEWAKVQAYVILEQCYDAGQDQTWTDRIYLFHVGAEKGKDVTERIDEKIFDQSHPQFGNLQKFASG